MDKKLSVVKKMPKKHTPEFLQQVVRDMPIIDIEIPPVTVIQKKVALQRKWYHVYPKTEVPEDIEILQKLIPSGLNETEINKWLYGSCQEACKAFMMIFNTSWTKTALQKNLLEQGASHALEAFDESTQKDIEGAIKLLSD